jgi:hypothetical protein
MYKPAPDRTVVMYYQRWRAVLVYAKNEKDRAKKIQDLFNEFRLETLAIAEYRGLNLNNPDALYDILAEQNQKWNELAFIFEKWNVHSYLETDGFLNMWNALDAK